MYDQVVPAERGGPGKSVHTAGRPVVRWSWRTQLFRLGLLGLGLVSGIVVLYQTLHLTGWPMAAASFAWGAATAASLTADLWLPLLTTPRPRYVPADVDGGAP
ncbi:hypothetical protein ACFZDG_35815 [Kitasatospora xanthocidica]|uniref:hypothetical protein n=1 Tax=Kitasatospora xanthocidica TaxID=83382 RepID=UPI0036E693D0